MNAAAAHAGTCPLPMARRRARRFGTPSVVRGTSPVSPGSTSHGRIDASASGSSEVQNTGQPWSHSTQSGLSLSPATRSDSWPRRGNGADEPFSSLADGVGQSPVPMALARTAPSSVVPPVCPGVLSHATCAPLVTVGVGQLPRRAIVSRLGVPALGRRFSPFTPLMPFCEEPYSVADGVG